MMCRKHSWGSALEFLLTASSVFDACLASNPLKVDTTVGPVYGLINGTTPSVAQFLGIPFAQPPIDQLRWAPPTAKLPVSSIDATQFSPSCPQYESTIPSVYNIDSRNFLITRGKTSEDCLTLNIWAPVGAVGKQIEKLPVVVWIYGGGFQTGGGEIGYQIPSQWVQRSQAHIVVGIKYIHRSLDPGCQVLTILVTV
jgi:carboxylesterase type B